MQIVKSTEYMIQLMRRCTKSSVRFYALQIKGVTRNNSLPFGTFQMYILYATLDTFPAKLRVLKLNPFLGSKLAPKYEVTNVAS